MRAAILLLVIAFAAVAGATDVPPPCRDAPCVPPPCVDRPSCGPGPFPVIEPEQVPVDNPLALLLVAGAVALVAARKLRRK